MEAAAWQWRWESEAGMTAGATTKQPLLVACLFLSLGLKRKERKLTTSNPRPLKILSVVAATLPPFRCKSHIISRVFNCGNIWDICSTCAGSTAFPRARLRPPPPEPPLPGSLSRLKNHRMTKKETTARVSSDGMLRDGSSSTIVSRGWYDDMCACLLAALACFFAVPRSDLGSRKFGAVG